MVGTLPAASGADHGSCSAVTEQQKTSAFWSTGLSCRAKAGQGLARWSGRGRAKRLGGVKLIVLIPLHVSHPDPGNYRAERLTPIPRQMPPGWKQMEERDGDRTSWVSLGKIPGAQLQGRQVTGERHSAAPQLCPPAQAGKSNLRHHMSPVTLGATLHLTPLVSKPLLSAAVPISCSYLSRGRSTAAPSASSARGLWSLCRGWMNQKESRSAGELWEKVPPLCFSH